MHSSAVHPLDESSFVVVGALENNVIRMVRRLMDVVISATLLFVVAPVLVLAAIAIKLDSRGPVLFRQVRVGERGQPFTLYKFRGMYVDAPQRWPELYVYDGLDQDAVREMRFHQEEDPRVTRVGRLLRRTSIDELPNLFNVLQGDMHLVGPRPEIPDLAPYYVGDAARILQVKPGVTSLAKATGRDSLTIAETIDLELRYLDCRSLRVDIKILLMTAQTVLAQRHMTPGG